MVQNKEIEEKKLTNGVHEVKKEENGVEEKMNGDASDGEESEEDDYLDYLLMVPPLDRHAPFRNKDLVSKSLLDFCTAIESRKEYPKIKQELLMNCVPTVDKQEDEKIVEENEPILSTKEDSPPLLPSPIKKIDTIEVNEEEVPEYRRQSIRLKKAQFVPEHAPEINDQFFVCRRCMIFFRTKKLQKQHNNEHHRRRVNGELIANENTKKRQRRSSANKDPFICDKCNKFFRQKALLRSHINTHMTEPCFFCPLCPYASKRNNDLKKHHETHHNPGRIVVRRVRKRTCEKCQEILDGKKAFLMHMREKHPLESPVKKKRIVQKPCDKCEEIFESVKAYREHMKEKHAMAPAEIRCVTCHRRFKTNFRLKKHNAKFIDSGIDCRTYFRTNGVETIFDCQHCEKKFSLKSHLTLHMKKHTSLTCDKCGVTFKNKFNLKWHEFSHLEIDPKCTNCLESFTSEQKFAVHLKKKICTVKMNGPVVADNETVD